MIVLRAHHLPRHASVLLRSIPRPTSRRIELLPAASLEPRTSLYGSVTCRRRSLRLHGHHCGLRIKHILDKHKTRTITLCLHIIRIADIVAAERRYEPSASSSLALKLAYRGGI
jgi:hypothetical protein